MSDLTDAFTNLSYARDEQDEAEAYYQGRAPEAFENPWALKNIDRLGRPAGHFSLNYARVVVQSRLSRLEISSVSSADNEAANPVLDAMWSDNAMDQESHEVHESALEFGESYVFASLNETGDGVDLFYNSPKTVRAFYSPDNPRKIKFIFKVWTEGDRTRVNLTYPGDRIERYISTGSLSLGSRAQDSDFIPYIDEEGAQWPEPDDGTSRWFHFRTGRPHGRPEHKDAYGPQNAINKLCASQMGSIDFVALPQRFGIPDANANGGVSKADSIFDDDDSLDLDEVNGSDTFKASPGSLAIFDGMKEVGEFSAANQEAFLGPLREYRTSMCDLTSTPITAFQGTGGQMPSGEARRAAEIPLVKRVDDLQRIFGSVWKQVYKFALELLGIDATVAVTWAPAESYEDTDTWQAACYQIAAGVPVRQVLGERGYTDAQQDMMHIPEFGAVQPALGDRQTTQRVSLPQI